MCSYLHFVLLSGNMIRIINQEVFKVMSMYQGNKLQGVCLNLCDHLTVQDISHKIIF